MKNFYKTFRWEHFSTTVTITWFLSFFHPFFITVFNLSKWFWLSVQVEGLFYFWLYCCEWFIAEPLYSSFFAGTIFLSVIQYFSNIHDWSLTCFSKNGLWPLIWFYQGSHKKHNPKLLKESVDKSLEMLQHGKLRGPHISGQFELDQVSWN